MSNPYERFEGSSIWAAIEAELNALVASGALALTTAPNNVIGALCERMESAGLLQRSSTRSDRATLIAALDAAAAGARGADWRSAIAMHYSDPALEEARRQAGLTALRLDQGGIQQEQASQYFQMLARRLREHSR